MLLSSYAFQYVLGRNLALFWRPLPSLHLLPSYPICNKTSMSLHLCFITLLHPHAQHFSTRLYIQTIGTSNCFSDVPLRVQSAVLISFCFILFFFKIQKQLRYNIMLYVHNTVIDNFKSYTPFYNYYQILALFLVLYNISLQLILYKQYYV